MRTIWNALLLTLAVLGATAQATEYGVRQTVHLGGEGGWDYLSYDPATQRLFISRGTHVQVVDPDSGTVVGDIPDTPGVHGIAIATGLDKAYTSNGRDNSLTVFAPSTLKVLGRIATPDGVGPDFIAFDPTTRQVLAFNGKSHSATFVDTATDRVAHTLPLAGKPEAAVSDGKGRMFVEIEDKNLLQVIDTDRAAVQANWPLPGCDEPAGLAIDREERRLFVACHNKTLLVLDAGDGRVVGHVAIGAGVDAAGFDAGRRLVFSAQGDGSLSVIQGDKGAGYRVVQTVTTRPGARTLAVDEQRHRVFLVTADFEPQPEGKSGRRVMKPDSFTLLVVNSAP
ncbi:YncE family protein [Burkholderiaceae bacterium UC74_6]